MNGLADLNGWHWAIVALGLWGLLVVVIVMFVRGATAGYDDSLYDLDPDDLDSELAQLLDQEERP